MGRRKIAVIAAAVLAAAIYSAAFFCWKPVLFHGRTSDTWCFWRAGRMALNGEASQTYNFDEEGRFDDRHAAEVVAPGTEWQFLPFLFTPPSLLLFAPLATLPYRQAEVVWFAVNAALLLFLPIWLGRKLQLSSGGLALSLSFPALLVGVDICLTQGQPSILIAALLGAVFVASRRGLDVTAGMLLALATIKPQLVLPMALAFVAARRWKLIASFLATGGGLLLLSCALVGWRTLLGLPATIVSYSHLPRAENLVAMVGLRGLAYHLFRLPRERLAFTVLGTLACLAIVWLASRRGMNAPAYGLTLVATLLVGYHCYIHDMALLAVLVPLLCSEVAAKGWNPNRAAISIGLGALLLPPIFPGDIGVMVTGYSLLLIALLFPLYKESRDEGSLIANPRHPAVGSRTRRPVSYCDDPAEHPSLSDAGS